MGSKSKRRHAQKQYNRAQNKVPAPANTAVEAETTAVTTEAVSPIMTPKEFRKAEKERAKQAKLLKKEEAKKAAEKAKDKKDKKEKN